MKLFSVNNDYDSAHVQLRAMNSSSFLLGNDEGVNEGLSSENIASALPSFASPPEANGASSHVGNSTRGGRVFSWMNSLIPWRRLAFFGASVLTNDNVDLDALSIPSSGDSTPVFGPIGSPPFHDQGHYSSLFSSSLEKLEIDDSERVFPSFSRLDEEALSHARTAASLDKREYHSESSPNGYDGSLGYQKGSTWKTSPIGNGRAAFYLGESPFYSSSFEDKNVTLLRACSNSSRKTHDNVLFEDNLAIILPDKEGVSITDRTYMSEKEKGREFNPGRSNTAFAADGTNAKRQLQGMEVDFSSGVGFTSVDSYLEPKASPVYSSEMNLLDNLKGSSREASFSRYDRHHVAGEHQSNELSGFKKFLYWLYKFSFFIGPGWLIAMAYLDPGNLEGDLSVGSFRNSPAGGFVFLWLLLCTHMLGWAFQTLSANLGTTTGYDLAILCRLEYSRPISMILWFFVEVGVVGADFQAVIGSAISFHLLFGIPIWIGVVITLVDAFTFLIIQNFGVRKLELLFAFLVFCMAICFWINFASSSPDIGKLFKGLLIPTVPKSTELAAIGLVGCVIMPHNLFLHSALVISRKVKRASRKRVQEANRCFAFETAISLIVSFLINLAVVGSFANPLISAEIVGEELNLYNAHIALQNAFGKTSVIIWAIGLLAAGQNATMAGTYTGQFLFMGFFQLHIGHLTRVLVTRLITIVPLTLSAFLSASAVSELSYYINMLQALLLPLSLAPLIKFCSSPKIMHHFSLSKRMLFLFVCISSLLVIGNFSLVMINLLSSPEISLFAWLFFAVGACAYLLFLWCLISSPVKAQYTIPRVAEY